MGGIGAERVFDDDDRQMGMLLAKRVEPTAGGVPLAVILGLTVLLDDRLGRQWDHFLEVGMDEGRPQQLMGIGDVAIAMLLHQAGGAMDLGGGEIGRTVQRHQVVAAQKDKAFQRLAALQAPEDRAERGPQARGIDRIENGPHLGVGRDAVDPIDGMEVVIGIAAAVVESQQGRVLEREHREGGHQGIGQGDFHRARPRIRKGANWERRTWKRASAERSFRVSPRARAMTHHSHDPSVKMETSEKHHADEFAKWKIETSLFSGRKPQAGNC